MSTEFPDTFLLILFNHIKSQHENERSIFTIRVAFGDHSRYFKITIRKLATGYQKDVECNEMTEKVKAKMTEAQQTVVWDLQIDQFGFPLGGEENRAKSKAAKIKYDRLKKKDMQAHFLKKQRRLNYYALEKKNIEEAIRSYLSIIKSILSEPN
jgi:hypothetical protein